VTGKEAIHLVRTAPIDQVRRWHASPVSCATLRLVCGWRVKDDDDWHALVGELGGVTLIHRGGAQRAEELWLSGFYTFEELAREAQITIGTARALKRTTFRTREWASRATGKNERAYRLVA
jgi:hypothetical protein